MVQASEMRESWSKILRGWLNDWWVVTALVPLLIWQFGGKGGLFAIALLISLFIPAQLLGNIVLVRLGHKRPSTLWWSLRVGFLLCFYGFLLIHGDHALNERVAGITVVLTIFAVVATAWGS
jgi:hypothetical protein